MLPTDSDGSAFRRAVEQHWLPALAAFEPELILISAGFDAHADDPLAGLRWQTQDYHWITEQLVRASADSAQGRIVASLEGGYNLQALGRSARAHVRALTELASDTPHV